MNRRRVLAGSGMSITAILAGCVGGESDTDDETAPSDDDQDPSGTNDDETPSTGENEQTEENAETVESARELGRVLIKAIGSEEYETALDYTPYEYLDVTRGEMRDAIEPGLKPDKVLSVTVEQEEPTEQLAEDEFDADVSVGESKRLTYTVKLKEDDLTYERSVTVEALELDGDWYGWLRDDLIPKSGVVIETEGETSPTVEVTLARNSGFDGVYIDGGNIVPSEYTLESVGESLTLSVDEEGNERYDIMAYYGSAETPFTEILVDRVTVTDVDVDAWRDVGEIELISTIDGWVGVSPAPIEGVTNPTLAPVVGRVYEITVTNESGYSHNIALYDTDDELVIDPGYNAYSSEFVREEGDSLSLSFLATSEITQYSSEIAGDRLRGDIVLLPR